MKRRSNADRRRDLTERPWKARRGIHGPRFFRTLGGAKGFCDAEWPEGEADILNRLTGRERWVRRAGRWREIVGGVEQEPEAASGEDEGGEKWWQR